MASNEFTLLRQTFSFGEIVWQAKNLKSINSYNADHEVAASTRSKQP